MSINLDLLMSLAQLSRDDSDRDLLDIESIPMPHKLKEAVKRKKEQQEDKIIEDCAESIIEILSARKKHTNKLVTSIRKLRSDERSLLATIKKLEELEKTAIETNDWIPLIGALGLNSYNPFS